MGETSSLLGPPSQQQQQQQESSNQHHDEHQHEHHYHHGSASVVDTIINEAKTCMGTGCLALPYAARVGGIMLHVSGLVAIGLWNIYAVDRLCQCLTLLPKEAQQGEQQGGEEEEGKAKHLHQQDLLEMSPSHNSRYEQEQQPCHHRPHSATHHGDPHQQEQPKSTSFTTSSNHRHHAHQQYYPPPPRGTSTYSRVAWYAFGPIGLWTLDVMMICLFIGVVVAFVDATRGFLRDTPVTTGSEILDAIAIAMIIGPMSAVPDVGYLSRFSAMGLMVLFASFLVIAVYGAFLWKDDDDLIGHDHENDDISAMMTMTTTTHDDILSSSSSTTLNWFPQNGIQGISQWFGCVVFGYGIAPLTYNFRESMAEPTHMVRASTAALLVVAGSYVILGVGLYYLFPDIDGDVLHTLPAEGWFPIVIRLSMAVVIFVTAPLLIVPCGQLVEGKISTILSSSNHDDNDNDDDDDAAAMPYGVQVFVRIGIALLCVSISVMVPGFVSVLSLVGCASVAAVGFVIPPLLFLRLRFLRSMLSYDLVLDVAMLVWGFFATAISTSYAFRSVLESNL